MSEAEIGQYDRFELNFNDYYFNYPGRIPINIHQSHLNDSVLLGIRTIAFVYISVIYIWSLLQLIKSLNTLVIYLTMVGFMCTWLYFALCTLDYFANGRPIFKNLHKIVEVIYQFSLCLQTPITLVFWTLLFPQLANRDAPHSLIVLQGYLHSIPLLFLILDLFFNSFSFPTRHISLLIAFATVYLLINMSYSLAVKPIYRPIPWTNATSYIIALCCLLLALFAHCIGQALFQKWKVRNFERIKHGYDVG